MTGTGTAGREAVLLPCPLASLPAPRSEHWSTNAALGPLPARRVVVIEAGPQPFPPVTALPVVDPDRSWAPDPRDPPASRAPGPLPHPRPRRESAGLLSFVATLMTAAVVVVFLGLAVVPHTGIYQTSTMLTGSMEPLLSPGDVLVLTPEPAADLEPGDVVAFNAPVEGRPVVTHRVVSVDRSGPRPVMTTKGDANAGRDAWQATIEGDTVWTVRGSIPALGHAITALRAPLAQLLLSRVLPLLLLVTILVTVWWPARPAGPSLDERHRRPEWRDHPVWLDLPDLPEPRGA